MLVGDRVNVDEGLIGVPHGEPSPHEAPRRSHLDLTEPEPGSPEQKVAVTAFLVGAVLWIAFLAMMVLDAARLTEIWDGFRDQWLVWQVVEGVLLLPWTLALAIWTTGGEVWVRSVAVIAISFITLYLFYPWKGERS